MSTRTGLILIALFAGLCFDMAWRGTDSLVVQLIMGVFQLSCLIFCGSGGWLR